MTITIHTSIRMYVLIKKLMQKQNIIAYKTLSCRAQRVQKKKTKQTAMSIIV